MSTSRLQEYVSKSLHERFGHIVIKENYRPEWLLSHNLTRLELDFYLPDLGLAIEVQGDQHYSYNSYFHKDNDGFMAQRKRDAEKQNLCAGKRIKLREVFTEKDADILIYDITGLLIPKTKYFYQSPSLSSREERPSSTAHKRKAQNPNSRSALKKVPISKDRLSFECCLLCLNSHINGEQVAKPDKVTTWIVASIKFIKQYNWQIDNNKISEFIKTNYPRITSKYQVGDLI